MGLDQLRGEDCTKFCLNRAKQHTLKERHMKREVDVEQFARDIKERLQFQDDAKQCMGKRSPIVFQSWRDKWDNLTVYFEYPEDTRKVIYVTESFHRQFHVCLPKPKALSR